MRTAATVAMLPGDPDFIAQLAKAEFEGQGATAQDSASSDDSAAGSDASLSEPTVESDTAAND